MKEYIVEQEDTLIESTNNCLKLALSNIKMLKGNVGPVSKKLWESRITEMLLTLEAD
jgi:hypothetical protein